MSEEDMKRTVVVTGGASGIGLSVARRLIDDGWRVILFDFNEQALEETRAAFSRDEQQCRIERVDVTDEEMVVQSFKNINSSEEVLRGLVNCAGIGAEISFLDTSVETFRKILEVNLLGTFNVCRAAARVMKGGAGGSIVNISSVSGLKGNYGRAAYGASKGGVNVLTKVMALELATYGIRVNAIAPGPIETPMVAAMHSDEARNDWLDSIPLRRYGKPEEVAGAIAFLLSEDASYMTGEILCVDGGFCATGISEADGSDSQIKG